MMRVLLFARARDLAHADAVNVALSVGATVGDLRRCLTQEHPQLAGLVERSGVAIDNEYAEDAALVPATAEVALVPPVSGG